MDILRIIKELNFPKNQYVVIGGAALELYGIRKAVDIDLAVTKVLFEDLQKKGWGLYTCEKWKHLLNANYDDIEVLSEISTGNGFKIEIEEAIEKASIINDIPVLSLEQIYLWKKSASREKDLKDLELIEEFLKKKEESQ